MSTKIKGNEENIGVTDDMEQSYELVEKETPEQLVESLANPGTLMFCSVMAETRPGKIRLYNALNTSEKLIDHINEELVVTDVAAYPVQLMDEDTGELFDALRTVLITKDNKSYACVSQGVLNSLKRIFALVGMPPWDDKDALIIIPRLQKTRNKDRKVTVLEIKES